MLECRAGKEALPQGCCVDTCFFVHLWHLGINYLFYAFLFVQKLPFLDGPLPSEGCSSPKAGPAAAKAPTPPQDCGEGAAPVLSNGPSLGHQKHKESPAQPRDVGASMGDGQAQQQG